jgi:hypothetical protein
MTTIPPRFPFVRQVVQSWVEQSIKPVAVLIFVPQFYKRFRRKAVGDNTMSHAEQLRELLSQAHLNQVAHVHEMITDWGPLTKFIGCLHYHHGHFGLEPALAIDYWMFGDDDVRYLPDTARYYFNSVQIYQAREATAQHLSDAAKNSMNDKEVYHSTGYTLFSAETRLRYQLKHELQPRHVTHIQGVDTYIIPSSVFSIPVSASGTRSTAVYSVLWNVSNIERIVHHYHTYVCPESFYQDDYMVSFLLDLAGVRMVSIRNPCEVGHDLSDVNRITRHNEVVSVEYGSGLPDPLGTTSTITSARTNVDGSLLINDADTEHLSHTPTASPSIPTATVTATGVGTTELALQERPNICMTGVHMVESIANLTTGYFQMHLHDKVFERETATQQCLMDTANDAYENLYFPPDGY